MWQVPDLFLWFFCSERGWKVSRDCLSRWHRMPAGGQGARGEVTVWHLLVFIGNEAILWHTAVHLNENRNSDDVPKDCQLQSVVLFSAAFSLRLVVVMSLNVACCIVSLPPPLCHFSSYFFSRKLKTAGMWQLECRVLVWGVCAWLRGCGSKVRWRQGGVIISLCHRCISLEYLWFNTWVTQLCMFAFTQKQRHGSCHISRKKSAMIVTKLNMWGNAGQTFCTEELQ